MKINLRIEFVSGETKDITAIAGDMVAFEREFEISIASLENEAKLTHLLYLAWASEHRRKETAKDFAVWVDDVASITFGDADPK
jgi:hypothetical protein